MKSDTCHHPTLPEGSFPAGSLAYCSMCLRPHVYRAGAWVRLGLKEGLLANLRSYDHSAGVYTPAGRHWPGKRTDETRGGWSVVRLRLRSRR